MVISPYPKVTFAVHGLILFWLVHVLLLHPAFLRLSGLGVLNEISTNKNEDIWGHINFLSQTKVAQTRLK